MAGKNTKARLKSGLLSLSKSIFDKLKKLLKL